jgi:diguanylate cyclase (GGDEF)-like protein/PAS domain S-box-containing protein
MSDVERIQKRDRKSLQAWQQHALKVLLEEGGLNKILFEALPVFFVAIDQGGKTIMMNEALLKTLGYREEDVVGKDCLTTFIPENERKEVAEVFDRLTESHNLTMNENSLLSKDGREVLVEWYGRPILKENDEVDFFFGIGIDITERRAAEEALRVEKAYFEQLFESAPEAVALVDNNSNIYRVNSEFTEMFGYTLDEVYGRSIDDLLAPDDLHGEAASLTTEVAAGNKVAYETVRKKKDGKLLDVSILGTPITVDGGQEAVYAIYRDITERKQAEELYRTLADTSRAGVYIVQDGTFKFINYNAARYANYAPEEMVGIDATSIVYPEDKDMARRNGARMLKGEIDSPYEFRIITKDGQIRWIMETVTSIEYQGKRAILGNSMDTTELRETRRQLEESGKRLSQIVEGSSVPTFVIDNKHVVTHWNKACKNLTGIRARDVIETRKQWSAFYSSKRPVMADLIVDKIRDEGIAKYYGSKYKKSVIVDGAYEAEDYFPDLGKQGKWLFITSAPLKDIDDNITGAIETLQDITERKQAEELMRESERIYQELSITDNLTKLYNQRHFYNQLTIEIDRSKRYKKPLSLLMLDVDDFKRYNDNFGHLEGDDVLVRLAQVIQRNIRGSDSAYRYGGEEFVIILPEAKGEEGAIVAERIREEFKKETFCPEEGKNVHVTVSIGASELLTNDDLTELIERADKRMYKAKKQGKDQVVFLDSR